MMKSLTLLSLCSLPLSAALPQGIDTTASDEEVEIKRYTVEVIIFSYEEDVYTGTEIFPPDPPPAVDPLSPDDGVPVFSDSQAANNAADGPRWIVVSPEADQAMADAAVNGADVNPFRLVLLPENEYMLGNALRKFELLDAYETMMHFGWTQPAYPQEVTPPIELNLFGRLPDGLDGTLTLYLSRYLHLIVDLALDAPAGLAVPGEDDSLIRFGDPRAGFDLSPVVGPQPVRFRIQEDRILKNGELRYFDHPKFGMLAKVTRVEEEADDAAQRLIGRIAE